MVIHMVCCRAASQVQGTGGKDGAQSVPDGALASASGSAAGSTGVQQSSSVAGPAASASVAGGAAGAAAADMGADTRARLEAGQREWCGARACVTTRRGLACHAPTLRAAKPLWARNEHDCAASTADLTPCTLGTLPPGAHRRSRPQVRRQPAQAVRNQVQRMAHLLQPGLPVAQQVGRQAPVPWALLVQTWVNSSAHSWTSGSALWPSGAHRGRLRMYTAG